MRVRLIKKHKLYLGEETDMVGSTFEIKAGKNDHKGKVLFILEGYEESYIWRKHPDTFRRWINQGVLEVLI